MLLHYISLETTLIIGSMFIRCVLLLKVSEKTIINARREGVEKQVKKV